MVTNINCKYLLTIANMVLDFIYYLDNGNAIMGNDKILGNKKDSKKGLNIMYSDDKVK